MDFKVAVLNCSDDLMRFASSKLFHARGRNAR